MPAAYDEHYRQEAKEIWWAHPDPSLRKVADELNRRYDTKIVASTISRWRIRYKWDMEQQEARAALRKVMRHSQLAPSVVRNKKVLEASLATFAKQLQAGTVQIRAAESLAIMRELARIEGAEDLRELVLEDARDLIFRVLKAAGLTKEQQERVIRAWSEEVRDSD